MDFEILKGVTLEQIRESKVDQDSKKLEHTYFYIKTDGKFTRKDILVAGGHRMEPPAYST